MSDKELTRRPAQDVDRTERTRVEAVYVPPVDIYESDEEIVVAADMPGADEKSVDVTLENDVLTIEGRATAAPPEGYRAAGSEFGLGAYRRSFSISEAVDKAGIKATVKAGVLRLVLPKAEPAKTRKIAIEAG